VSFLTQNFSIGNPATPHLHIYLDGGAANHFFNGTTNQVQPVANIAWQSPTSFTINTLSSGPHTIRLRLADGADQELQNTEAKPPDLNISIQAPPGSPTLTINSPAQGASLSPGPVLVTFNIQNSPVTIATQPRMHFYVDGNNSVLYKFYDGPGVTEDGNTSGVRYQNVHTHFVHWKSGGSIQLNALASGSHQVRFVLVDQSGIELIGTEKTLSFTILPGTDGDFSLQEVVDLLDFPTAMATAPDGRIFVNELQTGNIRVVTPTTTLPWQLQAIPFATLPVVTGNEKGLLGIAVDPNFSTNKYVYVFYTAAGPVNRVVRFTATTTSNGNTVATSTSPTVIFDNIPAANDHNGGFIQFGPDGMLYIFVGENDIPAEAQKLDTLRGKILRITPNGGIPSDNPFVNTLQVPFSSIYSLGHRNGFGFTFHSHTNDLWETENGENDNDQINRIESGGNYGWPIVPGVGGAPTFIDPIITFTPTIAPTGIVAIREDSVYPAQYHNNLLFAEFNGGKLHRIVLGGPKLTDFVSHSIACDCGQFGLLSVMHGLNVPGQDGYVYVIASGSGRILRVVLNNP
jgi:glucose/arabinose dehydrogenase